MITVWSSIVMEEVKNYYIEATVRNKVTKTKMTCNEKGKCLKLFQKRRVF